MHRRLAFAVVSLLALHGLAVPAHGQAKVPVPAVADTTFDNLVRVSAPAASLAVVHDDLGWLLFAHQAKYAEAQVTLHHLEAEGKLGEPILLKLPKPAALAKYPSYATGLAFHPKLPLLYVWQDIEFPKDERKVPLPLAATDAAAVAEFDHLLIYSLESGKPELLVGLARAPQFVYSRPAGSVAVDQAGERLYVPNIAGDPRNTGTTIGSYVLYPDGIPIVGTVEDSKALDEKPTAEARAAHIAAIQSAHQARKPVAPQRIAPAGGYHFYPDSAVGSGIGFVPVGRDKVLTGAYHATGLVSWTPEERQCRLQSYQIASEYNYKYPSAHPTLPQVYVSDFGSGKIYRFEHADANITLVPQRAELAAAHLSTPPVILRKANKLAVGGHQRVFLVSLDDRGKFKPERQQMLVGNHYIQALAYSEKYDRLYAAVEKGK
jgi:hypothetical protein